MLYHAAFARVRAARHLQGPSNIETKRGYDTSKSQDLDYYRIYLDGSIVLALGDPGSSIQIFSCRLYNSSVAAEIGFDNNHGGSIKVTNFTDVSAITDFTHNDDPNTQVATEPSYFLQGDRQHVCRAAENNSC